MRSAGASWSRPAKWSVGVSLSSQSRLKDHQAAVRCVRVSVGYVGTASALVSLKENMSAKSEPRFYTACEELLSERTCLAASRRPAASCLPV